MNKSEWIAAIHTLLPCPLLFREMKRRQETRKEKEKDNEKR
jgi:hypothetical protein